MTTTTKVKKPVKYDIKAMVGDLSKDVPPKSLQECLREAGGFPFAARVVVGHTDPDAMPIGADERFTYMKYCDVHGLEFSGPAYPRTSAISDARIEGRCPYIKRWQLLGHKT